jgi:hypothetical protein
MCNEFEELGFYVINSDGTPDDIERIKKFIDFIRHNEISFAFDDDREEDERGG